MNVLRQTTAAGVAKSSLTTVFMLLTVFGSVSEVVAQTARGAQAKAQSFEVAAVRLNKSGGGGFGSIQVQPGGSVTVSGVSLRALIAYAYGLDVLYEPVQGKSELLDQFFDVSAKAGADVEKAAYGTIGPLNAMLQNLLADRFKLLVRTESRAQSGYALVRAKSDGTLGPRIRPSDISCAHQGSALKATGDKRSCALTSINGEMTANGHESGELARHLATQLRRPVIDRTGLVGSYEMRMTFDPFELAETAGLPFRPIPPDGVRSKPTLFTALQEQLGLKLEPLSVAARVLIVERLEPPSEN